MLFPSCHAAEEMIAGDWAWPHFSITELCCKCQGRFCKGEYWHDPGFLDGLEHMRAQLGRPLIITSGHRCALWNAAIGGAPRSWHKFLATDLSLWRQDRAALFQAALQAGFTGLGQARTFLHIDRRPYPARWTYKRS